MGCACTRGCCARACSCTRGCCARACSCTKGCRSRACSCTKSCRSRACAGILCKKGRCMGQLLTPVIPALCLDVRSDHAPQQDGPPPLSPGPAQIYAPVRTVAPKTAALHHIAEGKPLWRGRRRHITLHLTVHIL